MGDRGQVLMKNSGVCLYSHWGGTDLQKTVRQVLRKKWGWDDEECLARIVFDEMIDDNQKEETGFGISTKIHGNLEHPLIVIDC